jgi:putative tryptophan/tyrosine transport system substrate-binding protein
VQNRRTFVTTTVGILLSVTGARAHGAIKVRRIGFLCSYSKADGEAFLGHIRPGLKELGWEDGRNIALMEPRSTAGRNDLLPVAAAEVVAQGLDLILVQSVPAALALMRATKSIPIVMVGVGNPVELGIVADYRHPGGNVTGSSYMANEYSRKLLQRLKEAAPGLRSVAVFANPSNEHAAQWVKQVREDIVLLGMQAQIIEVTSKEDFEPAFALIRSASTQSILLAPEPLIMSQRETIARFAQSYALPLVVVGTRSSLPASGLISFGPARDEYAQLAVRYIDRILKGAKPGDLAIEQTTRFNLVINLRTAKKLGLTMPHALLVRADEVVQ